MLRRIIKQVEFLPVQKFSDVRYRTEFDKVDVEESDICYVSIKDYDYKPTTEEVREDVVNLTRQRYINEGLEPPEPEDIDVEPYVID